VTQRGLTQSPANLSGKTIIDQVLRNAEAGKFELGYTILLPSIFNLYLHPDDYVRLSGIFPHIRDDARRALQDRIAQLNNPGSRGRVFRSRKFETKEYKIAGSDYVFEFFSDDDGSVPLGDVEIHSELAETPRPGFHGVRTTLIDREPSVSTTGRIEGPMKESAPAASERVFAEIRYEDDSGQQIYFVTQDEVSIGRGGDGRIVDLALYSDEEISREHLRLRRDPVRNRFIIVDRSMNGTVVDGRKLVRDIEETLPRKATIALAEHITMQFEQRS
jgi:FHA domain